MIDIPDHDWLAEHITTARWFAGKGMRLTITDTNVVARWSEPGDPLPVVTVLATVSYDTVPNEVYQLFLTRNDAGEWRDGTDDPAALAVFWNKLRDSDDVDDVTIQRDQPLSAAAAPRKLAGQQSNTSVRFGETAIVKFFRRIETGANPDIVVHRLLAGNPHVAQLFGSVSARIGRKSTVDLAIISELLPGAADGFELAVAAAGEGHDFVDDARALGQALASIHQTLAERGPTGTTSMSAIVDKFHQRLAYAAQRVSDIAPLADALHDRYARLPDVEVPTQLVHGDFHLGQAVRCPYGWRIIDFEGEPITAIDERSAPDSPLRDVAGMMRSLDYATVHSTSRHDDWRQTAAAGFLSGYRELSATDMRLMTAYAADKAVYEALYEATNRPDWLPIPLRALQQAAADRDNADTSGTADK